MATPIWKDTNYRIVSAGITYTIKSNGTNLYTGKAMPYPVGYLEIPINKICYPFLNSDLPNFINITDSAISQSNACKTFDLVSSNYTLSSYTFVNDWSYEDYSAGDRILSNPINGHMDSRMKLFYTVFKNNSGTICYTNEV